MASLQDSAIKRVDMYRFDPNKIQVDPTYNVRTLDTNNDPHDIELKESIRENGVEDPLVIRTEGENIFVVEGHRRLAAVKELIAEGVEIVSIPCLPERKGTSKADRNLGLIRSNSGKPLTPMQRAEVIKRQIGYGWDEAQIAKGLGCSRAHVSDMLALSGASQDVLAMVQAGEIATTTAVRAIKRDGDGAGETLAVAIAEAKANGKKKVSGSKVLAEKPAAPARETPASEYMLLRKEADEYIAALEKIARAKDLADAVKLAEAALGWNL